MRNLDGKCGRTEIGRAEQCFDYSSLPASRQRDLRNATQAIRTLVVQTAVNVVQIGLRLEHVHEIVGRDHFQAWLKAEFAWSVPMATRYRQSARVFANVDCVSRFEPGALYELSAGGVPEEARREALERARNGECIAQRDAREIVRRYRGALGSSFPQRKRRHVSVARLINAIDYSLHDRIASLNADERTCLIEHLEDWVARIRSDVIIIHAERSIDTPQRAP